MLENRAGSYRTNAVFADVILPRHISKTFTYLVPSPFVQTLQVGHRVLVPFGRSVLEGAVVSLSDRPPAGLIADLKEIRSMVRDGGISPVLFDLSRKIAERYVAPWGQCLRLILSANPRSDPSSLRYVVTDQGHRACENGGCPEQLRPTLERIARRPTGVRCSTVRSSGGPKSRHAIDVLEQMAWIAVVAPQDVATNSKVPRAGDNDAQWASSEPIIGNLPEPDLQWEALIAEALRAGQARRIVLHAPWTQRVNRLRSAIQQAQSLNKSVIVLAAETAKAEWLWRQLSTLVQVPITLSSSSSSSRPQPVAVSTPSVVIGTRSAIFAPLRSVGLIWIDGEEDPAFKEPQEPRYHAREVAMMRAEAEAALLVLSSTHPSLEATSDVLSSTYRVQPAPASRPALELVDLHDEPAGTLFSRQLVLAIQAELKRKTGVLLFLNRKGYAGALICRDCGWVPRCNRCSVAHTYYREAGTLLCRYCGIGIALPEACPVCRAARLCPIGEGTERVEMEARRLFPSASIARLDGDTVRHASAARRLWEGVARGTWDILIGTQALFQKGPIPPKGLVGIIQADSGLHVPDFRAAERTYHLLVDAAGLARPAREGGLVVLQTWLPRHHAVQALLLDEPRRFYEEELAARQLLHYPPTCPLANLSVWGREGPVVNKAAMRWRQALERSPVGPASAMILGPVPTIGGRKKSRCRQQILVKGTDWPTLCHAISQSVQTMEEEYRRSEIKFVVDMDPVEMG